MPLKKYLKGLGGLRDIQLPNESGKVDPRLKSGFRAAAEGLKSLKEKFGKKGKK